MFTPVFSRKAALVLILSFFLNTFLLWHFHDRSWAPQDDGYFAHIAERLLDGQVLNREVQSRHTGYIHFVHAGAMSLFGPTLVSLRYPLVLAGIFQSVIVFLFFINQGLFLAFLASTAITALGYIQILTPATHWYCLLFTLLAAAWLKVVPAGKRHRVLVCGILLGLVFLFRQLSGAFAAMGLVLWLFLENSKDEKPGLLARGILLGFLGVLFLYIKEHHDPLALALFAFWPFVFLFWGFLRIKVADSKTVSLLLQLAAGLIISALPLALYNTVHHSWAAWLDDTVIRSAGILHTTPFEKWSNFLPYLTWGLDNFLSFKSPFVMANGLYWIFLPLLPFLNGLFLFFSVLKKKDFTAIEYFSLTAVFYSLVSHLLQIPIYLYYSAGFSLIALLPLLRKKWVLFYKLACAASIIFILVGVYFHAGQPPQRGVAGIAEGTRVPLENPDFLQKAGVKMRKTEAQSFSNILQALEGYSQPGDSIFVFPNDAEIYFLSGRKNPFRFDFLPMVLQNEKDLGLLKIELEEKNPRTLLYHRNDKYGDRRADLSAPAENRLLPQLLAFIETRYEEAERVEEFSIYIPKK